MKRIALRTVATIVLLLLVVLVAVLWYRHAECEERGAAYRARVNMLERAARERLKVGTSKDAITKFFADEGIPLSFTANEGLRTIYTTGCAPFGCGSDTGLIGLRVKIDVSEPVVGALYTDCL